MLCKDIGLYYSLESKIDFSDNGKTVAELEGEAEKEETFVNGKSHEKAVRNAYQSLLNHHLPFDIVTRKNLKDLADYQIIILPNLLVMNREELDALSRFVRQGGSLYASKYTSLYSRDGGKAEDFLMSDLLGISYVGKTEEEITYFAPTKDGETLFEEYSAQYPLINHGTQVKIKAKEGVKILAIQTLPFTDPSDSTRFASIHSNPPGIATDVPAITLNHYGKGGVCYVAGDLEAMEYEPHRRIFINLIEMLKKTPIRFEAEAPKSVEVTVFHQGDNNRYLINLVNFQKELPNIPVDGIRMKIRLTEGQKPERLLLLPEERELKFDCRKEHLEFTVPRLETFMMMGLSYRCL